MGRIRGPRVLLPLALMPPVFGDFFGGPVQPVIVCGEADDFHRGEPLRRVWCRVAQWRQFAGGHENLDVVFSEAEKLRRFSRVQPGRQILGRPGCHHRLDYFVTHRHILGWGILTQSKVAATEKWLNKYGTGKALVLARFIPFVRTLINPLAGVVGIPVKKFFFWNVLGAIIWTQGIIGLGYLLGEKLEGSVDKYLLPVVGLIIIVSVIPVMIEFFREWSTRRHHS